MTDPRDRSTEVRRSRERGYRRALAWGMIASVALHAGAVLLWPGAPAASSPAGDGSPRRAPDPGRGIQAVDVRTARSAPEQAARRAPVEVPEPRRSEPTLERMDPVRVAAPSFSWAASGGAIRGDSPAPGAAAGGGGSGGDGLAPPVPRSLLPDWSPPEEVRGHRVTVRVEVDAAGRPTGRVELVPPTPSESFNRELRRRMTELEFRPARRDGRPVVAWAEITFTFGD